MIRTVPSVPAPHGLLTLPLSQSPLFFPPAFRAVWLLVCEYLLESYSTGKHPREPWPIV